MKRLIANSVVSAALLFIVQLHVVSGAPAKEATQASRLVRLGLRDGSSKVNRTGFTRGRLV